MSRNAAAGKTAQTFSLEPAELDLALRGIELLAERSTDVEELHDAMTLMAYLTAKRDRRARRQRMTARKTWAERTELAATPGMTRAQMTARRPAP